jgi:hypothetical protein
LTSRTKSRYKITKAADKKILLEDIPKKTMMVTVYALRWFFFLIFLFITIGIIALFLTGGENYVQMILTYSITGFFTFFMGYFGWILAQGVMDTVSGKDDLSQKGTSFYLSKSKKFKY